MLGIWGDQCINPEYDEIKSKYPNLKGSLVHLKRATSTLITEENGEDPLIRITEIINK